MRLSDDLANAMRELNEGRVFSTIRAMLDEGCSYNGIIASLNSGISRVGKRFEAGEYFIADLIVSGMIYRNALTLLMPLSSARQPVPIGRVAIGVVAGDIHDIGKDIIVGLLRAERFEVIDLGIDVKPERFAYAVRTYRPDVLLLSGVILTARTSMEETIKLIRNENPCLEMPILIGGMCVGEDVMKTSSADGWAYDSLDTVQFCKREVKKKYGHVE